MSVAAALKSIEKVILESKDTDSDKLRRVKYLLPDIKDFDYKSMKELLVEWALESGCDRFRLLANINESNNIFMWCDEEYNFIGMCPNQQYGENHVVDYSLVDLPNIIDHAEDYLTRLNTIQKNYNVVNLDIMCL